MKDTSTQQSGAADLDLATRREVLHQELADWQAARYRFQVRYRVATTIGDPKEHLDNIRRDLERCERALDALTAEIRALTEEEAALPSENGRDL